MSLAELGPLAAGKQPTFKYDGSPEDRLLAAYRAARAALIATLPANTKLDELAATVAHQSANEQMEARSPQVKSALQNNTDLSEQDALVLDSEKCRQYYLYKYILACDGLGVYTSGYGKQMASEGTFPGDYYQSIDDKVRLFSEIIDANDTGRLVGLVNAEKLVANAAQSARPSLNGPSTGAPRIIIGSKGTTIITPSVATGLGYVWVPWVVLGALGVIAGVVVYLLGAKKISETAATNRIICEKAMGSGNEKLAMACIDMQKEATNLGVAGDLLGGDFMKSLPKYLFIGGLVVLGATFLPQITKSLLKTQDVYQSHTAARAAANRRRKLHR